MNSLTDITAAIAKHVLSLKLQVILGLLCIFVGAFILILSVEGETTALTVAASLIILGVMLTVAYCIHFQIIKKKVTSIEENVSFCSMFDLTDSLSFGDFVDCMYPEVFKTLETSKNPIFFINGTSAATSLHSHLVSFCDMAKKSNQFFWSKLKFSLAASQLLTHQ